MQQRLLVSLIGDLGKERLSGKALTRPGSSSPGKSVVPQWL